MQNIIFLTKRNCRVGSIKRETLTQPGSGSFLVQVNVFKCIVICFRRYIIFFQARLFFFIISALWPDKLGKNIFFQNDKISSVSFLSPSSSVPNFKVFFFSLFSHQLYNIPRTYFLIDQEMGVKSVNFFKSRYAFLNNLFNLIFWFNHTPTWLIFLTIYIYLLWTIISGF